MAEFNSTNFCVEYNAIEIPLKEAIALKLMAYSVVLFIAVFGNILAVSVVLRNVNLKTSTNVFIVNMACSDLLIAFVCMPFSISSIAKHTRGLLEVGGVLGSLHCKMIPFLQGLSINVSIFTVTTLAFDRFLAIVYPFKNFVTVRVAKILIAVIWLVSIGMISPMLYAMRLYEIDGMRYCAEIWEPAFDNIKGAKDYTIFIFLFQYAIPLFTITALYSTLIRDLWRSSRAHADRRRAYKENKAVLKMLVTIIVTFAVCWLPIHATVFVMIYSKDPVIQRCGPKAIVLFIGWIIGHAHSAFNPVIYFTFNENFRKEIKSMIRMMKRCLAPRRPADDDEIRSRQSAQTVSFDLKRVSFSSFRGSSGKHKAANGTCNAAVEIIDEEKQGDVASSASTGRASLLSENDHLNMERIPFAEGNHVTSEKMTALENGVHLLADPLGSSLDKNSNVNLNLISVDVNALSDELPLADISHLTSHGQTLLDENNHVEVDSTLVELDHVIKNDELDKKPFVVSESGQVDHI